MIQRRYGRSETLFNRTNHFFVLTTGALFLLWTGIAQAESKTILALGDSLTAGYGLSRSKGFAAQLESRLVHSGISVQVIDAGVSGDTSAGGLARLGWLLVEHPDLVIVELGANDGLRGLDPSVTMANLEEIVKHIKETGAKVLLTGMKAPPNMGPKYTEEFDQIFEVVARKHNVELFPFFLKNVATIPHLNQSDGIHPNEEGVKMIVDGIFPFVITLLAIKSE